MSALSDLLFARTDLTEEQVGHLQRLVGDWQLLSDLAFSDLLLWVRAGADGWLCAAQCRPTTGPTAYMHDMVETTASGAAEHGVEVAFTEGRVHRQADPDWDDDLPIRREAVPVRFGGTVVAVLGRDSNLASVRSPSQLELVYLQTAADLAGMVADGTFPGPDAVAEPVAGPRVGDGLLRTEDDGTVSYVSPNGLSALRRLGLAGPVLGEPVSALSTGVDDPFDAGDLARMVELAAQGGRPGHLEVDGGGATISFRAIPLRPHGTPLGALVLLQDVTELRRRDRALMSKDATIREIHHRVKNNLQTVAALLRLQARRVAVPEARTALEESMRRIASIALVHETLSVAVDEQVAFDDVVDRLLSMLADVTGSDERVSLRREGSFGAIPAEVATALVLVLTELVQNAAEHAYVRTDRGAVLVRAERRGAELVVAVLDDGDGLPPGFRVETSDRLGLSIVRTLVSAELSGTLELTDRPDGVRGTRARVALVVPGD